MVIISSVGVVVFGFHEPRGKLNIGDKQETVISSRGMSSVEVTIPITVLSTWELTSVAMRYS